MLDKVKNIEKHIIDLRRYFHMNPEISSQEFNTQRVVIEELEKIGIEFKKAGNTSVIGYLKGSKPGKTVALRADMDALPIIEQSGAEYSSKNPGVMHACGHDAHTAMLLGAAKILSEMKDEIAGEVRFFFQEAEETFSGAEKIIEAGGMDGVDSILGMHGMADLETGYINVEEGYRMAGCDTIYVKFEGVSGHGSMPHLAKDTIHPACMFVTDLQGIITKNVNAQDPIVLSVGKFIGGTKANIVAKYTEMDISMRYFNPKSREVVHEAIKRHAKAIADAYEIKAEVNIEESTISLKNDPEIAMLVSKSAEKVLGRDKNIQLPRYMGSEDFPYYLEHAKGVFAYLGYKNEKKGTIYSPHHEKFNIDEDYLKYGTALYCQFALDFLNE